MSCEMDSTDSLLRSIEYNLPKEDLYAAVNEGSLEVKFFLSESHVEEFCRSREKWRRYEPVDMKRYL